MYESINDLEADVAGQLRNSGVPYEARQEVIDQLREHDAIAARLKRRNPFERFLQEYLAAASEAYETGERDRPLCDCRDPRCRLKRGNLPARIRTHDGIRDGIDEFRSEHVGDAGVLVDAQREWADRVREYREALREARHELVEHANRGVSV